MNRLKHINNKPEFKNKCDDCHREKKSRLFYTKIKLRDEVIFPYLCKECWKNAQYSVKYQGDL